MKISKRILGAVLCALLVVTLFAACNRDGGTGTGKNVSITFLNSKGEIQAALESVAKEYEKKTGVKVDVIAAPAGTSPFEKISSMYNSGTPPTLAMLDATDVVSLAAEKALDLSDEKWVEDAGSLAYRIDGKVYSFPMGVEGKGLIYNKTLLDKTLGKPFDPAEYNTLDKLTALFKTLSDKGVTPVTVSKEDWSLGAHFMGMLYQAQSKEQDEIQQYVEDLKSGKAKVEGNKRFNEIMDVFDLLKEYNISKKDPLAADYAVDPTYIADGKTAFWFNGNWAWANMKDFVDSSTEFGLMPVPLNNDPNDFVNNTLIGTASKQIMIDRVKATEEQQKAAKDFLNWFVYDDAGQKAMVETLNLVPAFKNITLEPTDPLSKVIKQYVDAGKTSGDAIVPSDHWSVVGADMQKYLAGKETRAELAKNIEAYWAGKK